MNEHSEALGAPRQVFESCTIIAWKGYRRFEFCAMSLADGELIARTSGFRKRGSAPVESAEARAALDRLVGYLTAVGWETQPAAEGDAWYGTRFVRPLSRKLLRALNRNVTRDPVRVLDVLFDVQQLLLPRLMVA